MHINMMGKYSKDRTRPDILTEEGDLINKHLYSENVYSRLSI